MLFLNTSIENQKREEIFRGFLHEYTSLVALRCLLIYWQLGKVLKDLVCFSLWHHVKLWKFWNWDLKSFAIFALLFIHSLQVNECSDFLRELKNLQKGFQTLEASMITHVRVENQVNFCFNFVSPLLPQHQQLQKTHKFVDIQFLIHISTNIYRNNTYNMSF